MRVGNYRKEQIDPWDPNVAREYEAEAFLNQAALSFAIVGAMLAPNWVFEKTLIIAVLPNSPE